MVNEVLDYNEEDNKKIEKNDIDRLFWMDVGFFSLLLLIYFSNGYLSYYLGGNSRIFFVFYWLFTVVYSIVFPFIIRKKTQDNIRFRLNFFRFSFAFIGFSALLYSFNRWGYARELFDIALVSTSIYFLIFSVHELFARTSKIKYLSILNSLGIGFFIIGILFKRQSWPFCLEMLYCGKATIIIFLIIFAILFLLNRDHRFLIRYLVINTFFLLFSLRLPLNSLSDDILKIFSKMPQ